MFGGTSPPNPKFETPESWQTCRGHRETPSDEKIFGVLFAVFEKIGENNFFSNPHIFDTKSGSSEPMTSSFNFPIKFPPKGARSTNFFSVLGPTGMRQKMPENGVEIGPRIKILPLKINVIRIFTMRVRKFRIGVNDNFVVYSSTLCVIGVEGMPQLPGSSSRRGVVEIRPLKDRQIVTRTRSKR